MAIDLYQPFTNPVTGESFQCLSSNDDAYIMEWIVQPEGYVPFEHIHFNQDEIFHVVQGEIRIVCDGKEQIGKAGDTITVPKGVRHIACNNQHSMLRCIVEYRPGLDYYKFFQCFGGLTLDRDLSRNGGVNIPKMLYFAKRMKTQALARPISVPGPLFGLMMNVFYAIGKIAGWEKLYRRYTGDGVLQAR